MQCFFFHCFYYKASFLVPNALWYPFCSECQSGWGRPQLLQDQETKHVFYLGQSKQYARTPVNARYLHSVLAKINVSPKLKTNILFALDWMLAVCDETCVIFCFRRAFLGFICLRIDSFWSFCLSVETRKKYRLD